MLCQFQVYSNVNQLYIYIYPLFYLFFINLFIYLFLAALGLCCCCTRAFSSCSEQGLLFVAVHRLLIAVASPVAEHGLQVRGLQQLWQTGSVVVAHGLQSPGSVVVAHGLSCSAACGIFPDQGSIPCPLHWQADSQPVCHQGSPPLFFRLFSHYRLLQSVEQNSLCYTVGPYQLSILQIVGCICQCLSPNLSLPPYSLVTISLFSTSVTLFLFCRYFLFTMSSLQKSHVDVQIELFNFPF